MRDQFVNGIIFGMIVSGLIFAIFLDATNMPFPREISQPLRACEADLPRDQKCEIVITAKVKE